jgi:hypothetical protein
MNPAWLETIGNDKQPAVKPEFACSAVMGGQ